MVAGLRHEMAPSPITLALSRLSGRLVARILLSMMRSNKAQFMFILARLASFTKVVKEVLPQNEASPTLVELAAGFSPRGIQLAQALPQLQVMEVDLPDVVEEKQRRLKKIPDFTMPANISWLAADLGNTALSSVLGGRKVHVVTAEGLNPYFPPPEITRIASHVRGSLVDGGAYISDIGAAEGKRRADTQTLRYFSRQAGDMPGLVDDEAGAMALIRAAGYGRAEVHHPSQIAKEQGLGDDIADYSYLVVGFNVAETPYTK
jgi:O-methyltransferase involved in polyketide biosynthesis